MQIEIEPRRIFVRQLQLIFLLLTANAMGVVLKLVFHSQPLTKLWFLLFDFNEERNIPTLYSSIALAGCAVLLWIIGSLHKRARSAALLWFGLSLVFMFLSVDETASIHELVSGRLQPVLQTSGMFYYAWVIPYTAVTAVIFAVYLPFLIRLPKETRFLFLLSGFVYVGGAVGIEMISASTFGMFPLDGLLAAFSYTCEDVLEMIGIAGFFYSLLFYMKNRFGRIRISIG